MLTSLCVLWIRRCSLPSSLTSLWTLARRPHPRFPAAPVLRGSRRLLCCFRQMRMMTAGPQAPLPRHVPRSKVAHGTRSRTPLWALWNATSRNRASGRRPRRVPTSAQVGNGDGFAPLSFTVLPALQRLISRILFSSTPLLTEKLLPRTVFIYFCHSHIFISLLIYLFVFNPLFHIRSWIFLFLLVGAANYGQLRRAVRRSVTAVGVAPSVYRPDVLGRSLSPPPP
jgi:hypothetical protein